MCSPRASSYLNSRLLGYVTIGYIEPRTRYLGNWSPRVGGSIHSKAVRSLSGMC